jgi:hypothetical protein
MVTELGGSVFEITHDLIGDLFRAKNAGVTSIPVEQGATRRSKATTTRAHEEARDSRRTGVRGALVVARATSQWLVCTTCDVELLRRAAAQIRRALGRLPPAPGEATRPSLPASMAVGCSSTSSISSSSGSAGRSAGRGEAVLDSVLGGGGHGSAAPPLLRRGPPWPSPAISPATPPRSPAPPPAAAAARPPLQSPTRRQANALAPQRRADDELLCSGDAHSEAGVSARGVRSVGPARMASLRDALRYGVDGS